MYTFIFLLALNTYNTRWRDVVHLTRYNYKINMYKYSTVCSYRLKITLTVLMY